MKKHGTVFGGAMLIAGTSIGGGMLALPVLTSLGGFAPSIVLYFATWIFMACTGLLFLEACLWMKEETNIISMADHSLGHMGRAFAWFLYLFFFYCVTLAYFVGGGNLFSESIPGLANWQGMLLFGALFAPFVFAGARMVDRINLVLMFGLILSFLLFVFMGYSHIDYANFKPMDWPLTLMALPVAFAAFGYQGIIPTLVHYMNYDVKKLRKTILIGSSIPLITYLIWQWLILGIVPASGLAEALANGDNAVYPLKSVLNDQKVYIIGAFFAFFALATSFFGVTLGMLDFLADGLNIEKTRRGRLFLCGLVYLPPLIFGIANPHVFLTALDYAGGFGSSLLLGLLPIMMVWSGRYIMKQKHSIMLPGGKAVLIALALFVLFELLCEFRLIFTK
jgi:tyrosine-specific transport protein